MTLNEIIPELTEINEHSGGTEASTKWRGSLWRWDGDGDVYMLVYVVISEAPIGYQDQWVLFNLTTGNRWREPMTASQWERISDRPKKLQDWVLVSAKAGKITLKLKETQ